MKRRILVSAVISVLLLAALAVNVHAAEVKITASDGAAYDFFGESVAISGDYAVVGAAYDGDHGASSGSAYIFKRNGTAWTQEAKISASDGAAEDFFGWSVAIS
ncbi:MAG: FG-GAP repeat protein, partial [Methanosarcinales archaeon]|nr:FG-GAP repeat protein [Methanosarcinales archaeon]